MQSSNPVCCEIFLDRPKGKNSLQEFSSWYEHKTGRNSLACDISVSHLYRDACTLANATSSG